MQKLKSFISANCINYKGKKVSQKLVIIESDDWGSIRTPSPEALTVFEKKGLKLGKSIYKYDALESQHDLELLFEILSKHKDSNNKPAKFTANAIMANPDFEKIKANDFQKYFFETFDTTLKKYPKHQDNLKLLKKGINSGIFQPQFHGREHVNICRWMKALQSNQGRVREMFDFNTTFSGIEDYSFMESYDWDTPEDIEMHKKIIAEGLIIFEDIFGLNPSCGSIQSYQEIVHPHKNKHPMFM